MSLSTIAGVLFGLGLVVGSIAISTDNLASFISIPSLLIVVGGTLAASFIGFQARYVIQALKDIGALVKKETVNRNILTAETGKIIRWGFLVKKNGILALEREAKSAKDQDFYLNYGIDLVITGYTPDEVREMLHAAAGEMYGRAMVNADILKNMTAVAPAFGMIGTLIGLIIMLQNIGGDPNGLGAGLAVALLTTLYGVLFARMVFAPAATKASQKAGIQRFRNLLISEGLAMLAEHRSPRFIQDKMNSYLDPAIHYSIDKKDGGGKEKKKKAA